MNAQGERATFGDDTSPSTFRNFMTTFGAVPVGGRNFYRLLKNGEAVLLFPGGVSEVGGHLRGSSSPPVLFSHATCHHVQLCCC